MDDAETVRRFLRLMEARDVAGAEALLAPGFEMIFPGGVQMQSLDRMIEWSRSRYARVRKSFDRIDATKGAVFVSGMLEGEWLDGMAFAGIRYVDRFEIAEGLILRQEVWNDMAEIKSRQA